MKNNPTSRARRIVAALSGLIALGSAQTYGTIVAYEGFNYPVNHPIFGVPQNLGLSASLPSLFALNGGTGWAAPWQGFPGSKGAFNSDTGGPIQADSLSWGSLQTSGGSVLFDGTDGSAQYWRVLANPIQKTSGSTYISFLGQRVGALTDTDPATNPEWSRMVDVYDRTVEPPVFLGTENAYPGGVYPYGSNLYPRGAALRLFGTDPAGYAPGEKAQFGAFSNRLTNDWSMTGGVNPNIDGDGSYGSGVTFGGGDVTLVVIRIDHLDSTYGDHVWTWINPDFSAGEDPDSADMASFWEFDMSDIGSMGPWAGDATSGRAAAQFRMDELRIGTTLADVIPGLELGSAVFDPTIPEPNLFVTVIPEPASLAGLVLLFSFISATTRRRR